MRIQVMTKDEAMKTAVDALDVGLAGYPLMSAEGIAASVRRTASFLCPATQRQIADAVLDAMKPLSSQESLAREQVNSTVEALVLNGDLVEAKVEQDHRLLFLGPPSFVERAPDSCLVIGIRPFGERLIRTDESAVIEYHRHTRLCRSEDRLAKEVLKDQGLHEIPAQRWAVVPITEDPKVAVKRILDQMRTSGSEIPGLSIVDRSKAVTYYRGRWREPELRDTGVFIGRRVQEYGAPLWCVVVLDKGQPKKMVDLPVSDVTKLGCDEAWRLQAALDSLDGHPQVFALKPSDDGTSFILDCYSPVPSWAEKFLSLKGDPMNKSHKSTKALFSFRIPASVVQEAQSLLVEKMWMRPVEGDVN